MQLPQHVRLAIERRAEQTGFAALKAAAGAMSDAYREGRPARLADPDRVAAYLVTRMPATYAATYSALEQLPPLEIRSILDVGAGTGAASLAASHFYPQAAFTLLERDPAMADAARQWLPQSEVVIEDAARASLPRRDLVVAAYSIGEFGADHARRLWDAAAVALVIVEPGTPRGFGTIRAIRDHLIAGGARVAAPCPAAGACPIADPDWCHFAARVERSSMHRRIKGGDLGYEDEKFSYIAFTRDPVTPAQARIVRRPRHQPGLIVLETCTPEGLRTDRVTKRDRDAFRAARHSSWGDAIER